MTVIETLQEQFATAKEAYRTIKTQAEQKVSRWFWASDSIYEPEPYYFEEHRFSKGKILKEEPADKKEKYHYGLDANDELIVVRQYTGLTDLYYETFFDRQAGKVESFCFDYDAEKKLDNLMLFSYDDDLLKTSYQIVEDGWISYVYRYDDKKLETKLMQRIYQGQKVPDRVFNYTYDELGILDSIREGKDFWYRKPNKSLSYKKLSELVANKLFEALKHHIAAQPVNEKLFCLNICYASTDLMPPTVGYGTEAEREQWFVKGADRAKWLLWNPADYKYNLELEIDKETERLFELFNQETSIQQKENQAKKIIIECCKQLKEVISGLNLDRTDDFVVIATDYEQVDLQKNFKQINHESYDKFKKLLV